MAQLINVSVLNALYPNGGASNIEQAFTGTGAAPFSVTVPANWHVQTLQVVPLALRYELTRWDRHRLRPYAVVGLGTYVTVSNQVTMDALRQNADLPPQTLALLANPVLAATHRFPVPWSADKLQLLLSLNNAASLPDRAALMLDYRLAAEWSGDSAAAVSTAIDSRYNYAPGGTSYNETITRIGWHF